MNAAVLSAMTTTGSAATGDQNAMTTTAAIVVPATSAAASNRTTTAGAHREAAMTITTTDAVTALTRVTVAAGTETRKATAKHRDADGMSGSRLGRAAVTMIAIARGDATTTIGVRAEAGVAGQVTPKAMRKLRGAAGRSEAHRGRVDEMMMMMTGGAAPALTRTMGADGMAIREDMRRPHAGAGTNDPPVPAADRIMMMAIAAGPEPATKATAVGSVTRAVTRKPLAAVGRIGTDNVRLAT